VHSKGPYLPTQKAPLHRQSNGNLDVSAVSRLKKDKSVSPNMAALQRASAPPRGGQTQVQSPASAPAAAAARQAVLHLRGATVEREEDGEASSGSTGRRIQWAEDVVDNEGLGRKKSKGRFVCLFCLFVFFLGMLEMRLLMGTQCAAYTMRRKGSMNRVMRARRMMTIAIVGMMGRRGRRGGKGVDTGMSMDMDMIVSIHMARGRGREEQGVRMRMRRCRSPRAAGRKRKAKGITSV